MLHAFKHGTSRQIDQCWISFNLNVKDSTLEFKLLNSVDKDAITAFTAHDVEIGNVEIPVGRLYGGALKKLAKDS